MRASYWSFHFQMRSTSPSRPRSCRVFFSSSNSRRSTTACVAMPAWSVPGIQSVLKPCIRFMRMRMSCSVLLSAWPRWRAPGHVRRRDDDRVRRPRVVGLGVEVAALFPEGIPLRLRGGVIVLGREILEIHDRQCSDANGMHIARVISECTRELPHTVLSIFGRGDLGGLQDPPCAVAVAPNHFVFRLLPLRHVPDLRYYFAVRCAASRNLMIAA